MAFKQVVRWMRSMTRPMPGGPEMDMDVLTIPPRPIPGAESGICAFVGAFSHGPGTLRSISFMSGSADGLAGCGLVFE